MTGALGSIMGGMARRGAGAAGAVTGLPNAREDDPNASPTLPGFLPGLMTGGLLGAMLPMMGGFGRKSNAGKATTGTGTSTGVTKPAKPMSPNGSLVRY